MKRTQALLTGFVMLLTGCFTNHVVQADLMYFENYASWESALVSQVYEIDLLDANVVALANEVGSAPSNGDLLGTNRLTFDPANIELQHLYSVLLLESTDFRFNSAGSRLGLEPSSSGQEDFRQEMAGPGAYALGMVLHEHQASNSNWEFFDSSNTSLGSFELSNGGAGGQFYGVVSDVKFSYAILTHSASENFAIGAQYLAVPEPSVLALSCCLGLGIAAFRRSRRQVS